MSIVANRRHRQPLPTVAGAAAALPGASCRARLAGVAGLLALIVVAGMAGDLRAQPSPGCADPVDPRLDPAYSDTQGIDLLLAMPAGAPGPAQRNYRVTVPRPSDYDPQQLHGLIFNNHGCSGSHQNSYRNVANHLADHYDLPTITIGTDSAGNCYALDPEGADFAYFQALKAKVLGDYCVDVGKVFFLGRSSGSFASQYFGCFNHATAIVGHLGGIATGSGPPPAQACAAIPTLLGSSLQDTTVPWPTFGQPARDWWIANNGCAATSQPDAEADAQVCARHPQLDGCECRRYDGCQAPFVQCTWNGGHADSGFDQQNMGWWLGSQSALVDVLFSDGFEP